MTKISMRVKAEKDTVLNGFVFKARDDGFAYFMAFPKQKAYISLILKGKVEIADYKKVVKKKVTKPKLDI